MSSLSGLRSVRRGATLLAVTLAAIGVVVGGSASTVAAAPSNFSSTTMSCTGPFVYGTSFSCTVVVKKSFGFSSADPTGTVTVGTILGRLPAASCTLVGDGAGTKTSRCNMSFTPIDTGLMLPTTVYGGSGTYWGSLDIDSLTVSAATLTITANDDSRGYGSANPSFSVAYAGFKNGDDETDLGGSLACSTTADADSPVGDYPIACSGLTSPKSLVPLWTDHYSIVWVDGTLAVGQVELAITPDDEVRLVGHSNPAFTVSYASFLGDDTEADLGGVLDCTTTAHEASPAGEYPITCTGLTSDSYSIVYHSGTLTVLNEPGAEVPGGSAEVLPGDEIEIDVHDWSPGSTVTVNGCGIVDGEIVVDENGDGHGVFTVPAEVDTETCEITLAGSDRTDNPAEVVLSLALLTPAGANSLPLATTALAALLAGLGLVMATRRRHAHGHILG